MTPDLRYIVVRGRLWRRANPALAEDERQRLVAQLMAARRAVAAAKRAGDVDAEAQAHAEASWRRADAMLDGPEAVSIIHLRTMHLGPEEILVAAKVEMAAGDVATIANGIDMIEARVRAAVPEATTIYLEPDLRREIATD